jgi:hypothetical protein
MDFIYEHSLIKIFQESFSFPVIKYNHVNNKTIKLRHNLIKEEAQETEDGINLFLQRLNTKTLSLKDNSLIEIADGLGDLGVVTLGGLYTFHLPVNLELGKQFYLKLINNNDSFNLLILKNDTSVITFLLENYILKEYTDSVSLEDYHGALNLVLLEIKRLWEFYLPDISYREVYEEIYRSNMSKACNTEETALKTIAQPQYKELTLHYNKVGEKYFVRRDDNKLIKSIDYSPACLINIVYPN